MRYLSSRFGLNLLFLSHQLLNLHLMDSLMKNDWHFKTGNQSSLVHMSGAIIFFVVNSIILKDYIFIFWIIDIL